MNNITIGIPRALHYYKYKYLWQTFFKELGVNILISPHNDDIKISDNLCKSLKIYMSHINYLVDKVDYILIPRIVNKNKCNYYSCLYDIVNNSFDINILDYNVDQKNTEEDAFMKIGMKLGFCKEIVLNAYKLAKKEEYKQNKINYLLQQKKLQKDNKKILVIADEYIYNDEQIKIKLFNKLNNIDVIYANYINPDEYKNQKEYKQAYINSIKKIDKKVSIVLFISSNACIYNYILFSIIGELISSNKIYINIEDIDNIVNKIIEKVNNYE